MKRPQFFCEIILFFKLLFKRQNKSCETDQKSLLVRNNFTRFEQKGHTWYQADVGWLEKLEWSPVLEKNPNQSPEDLFLQWNTN